MILERLALARLCAHILTSPNFSPFQSAYRPFHSTETAAVRVVNDLLCTVDSGSAFLFVSLDLTVAFNTINHSKLEKRLTNDFGVKGVALSWINSYLHDRTKLVRVGQSSGAISSCTTGVPQGSVLGPLFFAIYISPISRLIDSYGINHHKYADDATLYVAVYPNNTASFINSEAVSLWFLHNDMQLNPSKSEAMFVGSIARKVYEDTQID